MVQIQDPAPDGAEAEEEAAEAAEAAEAELGDHERSGDGRWSADELRQEQPPQPPQQPPEPDPEQQDEGWYVFPASPAPFKHWNADVMCLLAWRGVAWRRLASRGVAWRRVAWCRAGNA